MPRTPDMPILRAFIVGFSVDVFARRLSERDEYCDRHENQQACFER
jgi:hypothetical protein